MQRAQRHVPSGQRELLPLVDKEDNIKFGKLWDSFWLFFKYGKYDSDGEGQCHVMLQLEWMNFKLISDLFVFSLRVSYYLRSKNTSKIRSRSCLHCKLQRTCDKPITGLVLDRKPTQQDLLTINPPLGHFGKDDWQRFYTQRLFIMWVSTCKCDTRNESR